MQPYMTSEQLERFSECFSEFSTHILKATSAFSRMAKCVWIYAEKNSKIKIYIGILKTIYKEKL